MGLAYPTISNLPWLPFFNHAFMSGAVSSNRFAFKLASSGSQLFLGGEDRSLFSGSFETHSVDTRTGNYFSVRPWTPFLILFVGYWQITGASAIVNGNVALSGFDTMLVLALRGDLH